MLVFEDPVNFFGYIESAAATGQFEKESTP
jgi:hypothetical protein